MPGADSAGSVLAWSASGLLAVGDRDGLRVYDPAARRSRVLDRQPVAVPVWDPRSARLAYEATATHALRLADLQGRPRTLHRFAATSTLGSLQWLPRRFPGGKTPEPVALLVRERSDGLELRAAVSELSVRGDEVAFLACRNVVGVWNPATRTVRYPLPEWTRPPLTPYACVDPRWQSSRTSQIGLSDLGLAYWRSAGGNQRVWKFLVGPPPPGGGLLPWPGQGLIWWSTTTGGPPRAGWTHSDRDLLIVSTREVSFAAGTVTVDSQTLWRIETEGYPGSCPIFDYFSAWHLQPGRCKQLAAARGQLLPLDVDAGRIAVLRADGSVAVLDGSDGHTLTATPAETPAVDARLSSSDLVVLRRGSLDHYNAATGALLHSWPLPDIAAGRRCDFEEYGCPAGNRLTLEDTARGVAAYILDGRLHVLRLSDGRDLDLAAAELARFTDAGLVYTTPQQGDWQSRLTFVSDRELSNYTGSR